MSPLVFIISWNVVRAEGKVEEDLGLRLVRYGVLPMPPVSSEVYWKLRCSAPHSRHLAPHRMANLSIMNLSLWSW